MLSVSVADRVRFKSKKGDIITALPVTVEFGKFVKGDRTSRLANLDEWNKLNLGGFDSDQVENTTILCYLPPFDGHYPPLPGVYDWDKPESLTAMQDEIEKWRQKSLESYQSHFTCLTRLQQEVLRLHNLLRRQETTITFLKKENYILQARLSR
ncbi:uncharacterized protein LOC111616378, partial [Centruroides sculpturatus]|uniref:uncharacterized protein LOC111616378 n=1 Tax=Centruroides sculpturatus TaxID=218467 RepID=UPI000C6CED33